MPAIFKREFLAAVAMAAVTMAIGGLAHAQEWPTRPITILVPQPAGAIQDLVARTIGEELSRIVKQPVVVENKPGASQIVASNLLARSPPDGYTLMVSVMPNVIAPKLLASQNFSGNQDFTTIGYSLALAPLLTIAPQVPASNLKEFIALLKANPGQYMYGSAGVGTPLHMFLEQFNRDAGTQSVHVPYKSFPPIIPDITGNVVQYSFLPLSMMQFVKEGKMKALGFAGPRRDPQLPDMPTLDEQGLKGFDASLHYFVVGPKGMPAAIVARLNAAMNEIQAKESYQAKYKALGGVTVPQNFSPMQAAGLLKQQDERYTTLAKEGKIAFD